MKESFSSKKYWYAVKTRFKSEKKLAADLRALGVNAYLPLVQRTRRYTRKIKHYSIPLINSYLFVFIDRSEYIKVLERSQVIEFIRFGGRLIPIPDEEINTLQRICGELNTEVHSEQIQFVEGEEVELVYGQLSGIKGKLVRELGKEEFVVQLQFIGYQLRIVAEGKMLMRPARMAMY